MKIPYVWTHWMKIVFVVCVGYRRTLLDIIHVHFCLIKIRTYNDVYRKHVTKSSNEQKCDHISFYRIEYGSRTPYYRVEVTRRVEGYSC